MRRPVSTSQRGSGCRLVVKRCALGPAGRPVGDGGAEHPLGGGQVGPGARRGGVVTVVWAWAPRWRGGGEGGRARQQRKRTRHGARPGVRRARGWSWLRWRAR